MKVTAIQIEQSGLASLMYLAQRSVLVNLKRLLAGKVTEEYLSMFSVYELSNVSCCNHFPDKTIH